MSYATVILAKVEGEEPMVYRLPKYEVIERGDEVVVEGERGKVFATVVDSAYLDESGIRLVKELSGVTGELPKVLSRVFYSDFDWGKNEED